MNVPFLIIFIAMKHSDSEVGSVLWHVLVVLFHWVIFYWWTYHIHFPVNRYLSCSYFLIIMNNISLNIHVQVCMDLFFQQIPRSEINESCYLYGLPWWLRQSRICLPVQITQVRSLGWEDSLEKGMATHSSILAWRIPWPEEPDGL